MTPEQTDILVRAAQKLLTHGRNVLDYLNPLMPIAGAVIGWLAASFQFRSSFRKNLEKEDYYASKEHVMEIVKLHSQFLSFFYEFYKSIKNTFNAKQVLPSDVISDFITGYNFRLAEIYQLSRIEFPGQSLEIKPTIELLKKLEAHIIEIDQTIGEVHQKAASWMPGTPAPTAPDAAIFLFNRISNEIIDGVTSELTKHENPMVQVLADEATRLGLRSKRSTAAQKKAIS
jgi:hypothetical protein